MSDLQGLIIAGHGRHYLARADHQTLQCVTRGKKSDVATGDLVRLALTSTDQAVIEEILPRTTLLYRSDQYKSKLLAANVTQLFIVVATEPGFSDDLVSRALVAANAAGIRAHIILNKTDVSHLLPAARSKLELYGQLGYPIHEVSAKAAASETLSILQPLLAGQSSILIASPGWGNHR